MELTAILIAVGDVVAIATILAWPDIQRFRRNRP